MPVSSWNIVLLEILLHLYDPGPYPHSRDCEWVIEAEAGSQIRLNVTAFELESHSSCNYDYLEIR